MPFSGREHGSDRPEIRRHLGGLGGAHPQRRAPRRQVEGGGPRPGGGALGDGRRDRPPDRSGEADPGAARSARARRGRRHRRAGHHRLAGDGADGPWREGEKLHRLAGEDRLRLGPQQGQDRLHRPAKNSRRSSCRLRGGGGRLPGGRRARQPHHARARRLRHLGGRARRGAQGRRVPYLHRRRRRLHDRPAPGARGAPPAPRHLRGNDRDGGRRLQGAADPRSGVRRQVQSSHARALQPHQPGAAGRRGGAVRHADHFRGRPAHGDGEGSDFGRRVQPRRGEDHGARRSRPSRRRVRHPRPDRRLEHRRRRHRAEHRPRRHDRPVVYRAPHRLREGDEAPEEPGAAAHQVPRRHGRRSHRQGVDRRHGHALARRHRRADVPHAGRGGHQHPDDLDLGDQDHRGDRGEVHRARRARPAQGL